MDAPEGADRAGGACDDGHDLDEAALGWVLRLTSGEATDAEAWQLAAWRARSPAHEQSFQRARRLWDGTGAAARLAAEARPPRLLPRRAVLGATAAIGGGALLPAGAALRHAYPFAAWLADESTVIGERRWVRLAEGITAELNTRSWLDLGEQAPGRLAIRLLGGEAAFQVSPTAGATLAVEAAGGCGTLAAGTLNTRILGEEAEMLCVEGEARVSREGEAVLRPGQGLRYGPAGLGPVRAIDLTSATAWRRGMLVFNDLTLAEMVAELNRYRPGRILVLGGQEVRRRVAGVFQLDRLEEALDHIARTLHLRLVRLPAGLVLLG